MIALIGLAVASRLNFGQQWNFKSVNHGGMDYQAEKNSKVHFLEVDLKSDPDNEDLKAQLTQAMINQAAGKYQEILRIRTMQDSYIDRGNVMTTLKLREKRDGWHQQFQDMSQEVAANRATIAEATIKLSQIPETDTSKINGQRQFIEAYERNLADLEVKFHEIEKNLKAAEAELKISQTYKPIESCVTEFDLSLIPGLSS